MYCYNCGKEISDSSKFCPHCGTQQNKPGHDSQKAENPSRNSLGKSLRTILPILIVVILGLFTMHSLFGNTEKEEGNQTILETQPAPTTEVLTIEDGWRTENGEKYFYSDGEMYVDLQKIDGDYYYFNEDGTLAINTDVDYDAFYFRVGDDGKIDRTIFKSIFGEWSDERYRYGNNGRSLILELEVPIENCSSMSFYLEANGERGAKANGKWEIYVRNNGKWEFIQEINYTEPNGVFEFEFDEPKSFDAITAYPMVTGNATISVFFCLQNVDCPFEALLSLIE